MKFPLQGSMMFCRIQSLYYPCTLGSYITDLVLDYDSLCQGIGKPVILLMPVSVVRWRNFQDYLVSCHTCLLSLNTSFQWNKEMTGLPFIELLKGQTSTFLFVFSPVLQMEENKIIQPGTGVHYNESVKDARVVTAVQTLSLISE
ncbi:hypothetical protein M9H77_24111 [Catharanthus roseus]|uniref:Uncharacterized protein n=1 Tax=Catharanthus roseus TaxID=4058 RepID=A0ACC0AXY1_CATRO|nr:hypothetical protein M9H77_24111 [Catharanthus roseus]